MTTPAPFSRAFEPPPAEPEAQATVKRRARLTPQPQSPPRDLLVDLVGVPEPLREAQDALGRGFGGLLAPECAGDLGDEHARADYARCARSSSPTCTSAAGPRPTCCATRPRATRSWPSSTASTAS